MFDRLTQAFLRSLIAASLLSGLAACGGPSMDPTTALGKAQILDQANIDLSNNDCSSAVSLLKPVYNSENTDNKVRMAMASAYGCDAHVNVFQILGDTVSNIDNLLGSGFWDFLATEFPSTTNDRVVEAAQLAQDAVQSIVDPGAVILPSHLFDSTSFNPGTLSALDRTDDANAYLFFVSMAGIGGIESRYGSPYSNGKRGTATLPWTVPTEVKAGGTTQQADGCAYASAIVNFADAVGGLATATSGDVSDTFAGLDSTFSAAIYAACDFGCVTICGISSCPSCPDELRNRSSCAGTNTDPASCAAAGITTFMVSTPGVGWDQGP